MSGSPSLHAAAVDGTRAGEAAGRDQAAPNGARASFVELCAAVQSPDGDAAGAARAAGGGVGAGRLADLTEWLAGTQGSWPPRPFRRPCLVLDRPCPPGVAALADRAGTRVRVVGLTGAADPLAAFARGAAAADREIESGADVLVVATGAITAADPDAAGDDADTGAHTAAAVVVGLLTGAEPVALLPRGPAAVDTAAWVARAGRLRDGRRETADLRGRPDALLTALGSAAFAAAAGVLLQAVARRTPVLIDGTPAVAAALLCSDHQTRVTRWLQVADSSPEPVHARAVADLRLQPVLELGTDHGDGTAGLLALDLLSGVAALAAAGATAAVPA